MVPILFFLMEYNAGYYITNKIKSRSLVSIRKKSKVDDMNFEKIQIQDYTGARVLECLN